MYLRNLDKALCPCNVGVRTRREACLRSPQGEAILFFENLTC